MRLKTIPRDSNNHIIQPSFPLQYIDIDFFYLPKSGHFKYVLNIACRYSKKIFAVPATQMTAGVVVKALERVFSVCGRSQFICGDNQISLLRNSTVLTFCNKWNCKIRTGIPYNSRSQALIETLNGSLKYIINTLCIQHDNTRWQELVPLAVYIHNTSPNTGLPPPLTPDEVFFGRPVQNFPVSQHRISGHIVPDEYVQETTAFHDKTRKAIEKYNQWKTAHIKKPVPLDRDPFAPGKYVYMRRIQPGIKDTNNPRYVNTIYRIDKAYRNWVVISDVFKVTSPPYRLTTSRYFLKPYSERDPFLFHHLKPDQVRLGKPLLSRNLPVGDETKSVPTVYDPAKPRRARPNMRSPDSDHESSMSSTEQSDDDGDVQDDPLLERNLSTPDLPAQDAGPVEIRDEIDLEPPTPLRANKGGRNIMGWVKNVFKTPGQSNHTK